MLTREGLGEALLGSLEDVSALLQQAHSVAVEEQDALVKNDAEMLVRACRAQEDILRRISESDQQAADMAAQLAEIAGLDPDETGSDAVIQAAIPQHGDLIVEEINRIGELARKVQNQHEINSHLLSNGLDIIACCLRTLANDPGPNSYSQEAAMSESGPCVLSLDRKA